MRERDAGRLVRRGIPEAGPVVEAPGGAHFTSCVPDYDRDERFQKEYVTAAKDPAAWQEFSARYLEVDEAAYQAAVKESA